MDYVRLGEFEQSLLLAVAHLESDAYGVTIRREIERRTGSDVAIGAIYTSLNRLERKRYVKSFLSESLPQRGGRSRRYFRLTADGIEALRASHRRLTRMWAGLEPGLKRLR
ncbi:MAG: PadR family transcriptional regulator [Acidobacteriota bacterium]